MAIFGKKATQRGAHHWRGVIEEYRHRLPVSAATPVISLLEGGTPLIHAAYLSELLGNDVWIKYEGLNPTGSFKDRGMTMAISKAAEAGAKAKAAADAKAKIAADAKAKADAEASSKEDELSKTRRAAEAKDKVEAEARAKEEDAIRARRAAEAKARDAESKSGQSKSPTLTPEMEKGLRGVLK